MNMITFHLENNHMSWTDIMQEIADRYSGNQFPTISTLNSFSTANYILFKISLSEQRRAKVCLRNLADIGYCRIYQCITKVRTMPRGYKLFFMPNSIEHEISLGHKNKNTNN